MNLVATLRGPRHEVSHEPYSEEEGGQWNGAFVAPESAGTPGSPADKFCFAPATRKAVSSAPLSSEFTAIQTRSIGECQSLPPLFPSVGRFCHPLMFFTFSSVNGSMLPNTCAAPPSLPSQYRKNFARRFAKSDCPVTHIDLISVSRLSVRIASSVGSSRNNRLTFSSAKSFGYKR